VGDKGDTFMPTVQPVPDWQKIAQAIDHTVLKTDATRPAIIRLCEEAKRYGFASVCIQPCHVGLASRLLHGSAVKVCTVIGFPQGATLTSVKVFEATETVREGAQELDVVINVGALLSGDREFVLNDIRQVAEAAHGGGAILKVIIETCLLTREEKILACQLAVEAGADFVKTSTGMSSAGATIEDVALMRATVGPTIGVKAAGGIRTAEDAIAMLQAGANRIGASASIQIVQALGAQ
jgi:deoxyribose-phosphate aldolase